MRDVVTIEIRINGSKDQVGKYFKSTKIRLEASFNSVVDCGGIWTGKKGSAKEKKQICNRENVLDQEIPDTAERLR